ncbi:hypothetical protein ACFX5K_01335 [Rickettsiales bacterium LUAb2]
MKAILSNENMVINGNMQSAIMITRLKTPNSNHDYKQLLSLRHMINPAYYDDILKFQKNEAKKYVLEKVEDRFSNISDDAKNILYLLGLYSTEKLANSFSVVNAYLNSLRFNKRFTQSEVDEITNELNQIINTLQVEYKEKNIKVSNNSAETEALKAKVEALEAENSKVTALEKTVSKLQEMLDKVLTDKELKKPNSNPNVTTN